MVDLRAFDTGVLRWRGGCRATRRGQRHVFLVALVNRYAQRA